MYIYVSVYIYIYCLLYMLIYCMSINATKPVVVLDPKESLIQELKKEIAKLRRHNAHLQRNLQDNMVTCASMALQGDDEAEAAEAEDGAQAGANSRASRQHRFYPQEENALSVAAAARRGRHRDEQGGQPEQRQHLTEGVPGRAVGSGGYEADAGGGVGERMYAHKLACKTRYVLSEHRRAQEMRRGHGDLERPADALNNGRHGRGSREVESGDAEGNFETERDARLLQELQQLMHEYVEHQGRAAVPGAEHAEALGVGRRAGRSSSRAVRCDDGSGGEGGEVEVDVSEHGAWEEWEDGEEEEDLLNLVCSPLRWSPRPSLHRHPLLLLRPPQNHGRFRAPACLSQEMRGAEVLTSNVYVCSRRMMRTSTPTCSMCGPPTRLTHSRSLA